MKAKRSNKFAVKAGRDFPVTVVGEAKETTRVVIEVTQKWPKEGGMSARAMAVAMLAILVTGTVTAATVYGVATNDYTVLRELAASVKTALELLMKALK